MYGQSVGTGAAAGAAAMTGLHTASQIMLWLAVILTLITVVSVVRRARRTGEHQRP